MIIYLGADHAGFEVKEAIKKFLLEQGYEVKDCGAFNYNQTDDYPDFMKPVAEAVAKNPDEDKGVIVGGSGQGEAMVANRRPGVRAAVFYGGSERALALSRQHNNANILSLGAFFLKEGEAINAVKSWLETPFSRAERHVRRLAKID